MKHAILTLLSICLSVFVLNAQEIVISGTVVDARTGSNVPFANIGIEGTAVGTVSNHKGEYEFHFDAAYLNDVIQVTCIGYTEYATLVKDIKSPANFTITIQPKIYDLDEYTVRPQELTPQEIVRIALKRMPTNYISKSHLMDGFYREYFRENGKYVGFAEASVNIFDEIGYNKQLLKEREDIKIDQLRVSDIYNKGAYVLYIDINYALRGNLLRNADYWMRYAKKSKHRLSEMAVDSIAVFGKDLVYCISYEIESKKKGKYEGNIFVRTRDFAILRFEINAENLLRGRVVNGAPNKSHAVLTYKEHDGKLYLNYINASHDVLYWTRKERYDLEFNSELLINNVHIGKEFAIPENEIMKESSIFYQPRYRTYDPAYWSNYNLFADSPNNALIVENLELNRDLETQYRANGKLKIQKPAIAEKDAEENKKKPVGVKTNYKPDTGF